MAFADHLARMDRQVLSVLGEVAPVTYRTGVGAEAEVSGLFEAAYLRADAGGAGISSSTPAVFLRLADLPMDPEDDTDPTVIVDGVAYSVREVKKDGQGAVVLMLHRA